MAEALDYAHGHGVVHRDIKPGNILLSERGEPMVADFGIALAVAHAGAGRVTETGLSLGTPHYMSPEQATGDRDVDPRTDVYALGSVLYEMLTGDPPYQGSTAQAVLGQIITGKAWGHRDRLPESGVWRGGAHGLRGRSGYRFVGGQRGRCGGRLVRTHGAPILRPHGWRPVRGAVRPRIDGAVGLGHSSLRGGAGQRAAGRHGPIPQRDGPLRAGRFGGWRGR